MKCEWQAFINIIPIWMRQHVDKLGKDTLRELRLRRNLPPELITNRDSVWLERVVTRDDLEFCINVTSKYSMWAQSTLASGYITAPGGHRLGICGTAIVQDGVVRGIKEPTSIVVRVARDFLGIAQTVGRENESLLILGKPGSGKTTLLRDLVRQKSDRDHRRISVVDERQELFPAVGGGYCFYTGRRTDVLSGYKKAIGIDAAIRCMTPEVIAVDEITAGEDCDAMVYAGWCGVKILATAHAGSREELFKRPVYKPIIESGLFDKLLFLHSDNTWHIEGLNI